MASLRGSMGGQTHAAAEDRGQRRRHGAAGGEDGRLHHLCRAPQTRSCRAGVWIGTSAFGVSSAWIGTSAFGSSSAWIGTGAGWIGTSLGQPGDPLNWIGAKRGPRRQPVRIGTGRLWISRTCPRLGFRRLFFYAISLISSTPPGSASTCTSSRSTSRRTCPRGPLPAGELHQPAHQHQAGALPMGSQDGGAQRPARRSPRRCQILAFPGTP